MRNSHECHTGVAFEVAHNVLRKVHRYADHHPPHLQAEMVADRRSSPGDDTPRGACTPVFGRLIKEENMSGADNKALARRYLEEVWSRGNTDVIDVVLSENYTLRALQGSSRHEERVVRGTERLKQSVELYHRAFPNLQISPQTLVAEDDRVVVEWTAQATHSGDFRGIPPTGKQVSYAGISIYRIEGDRIVDEVYLGDRLGLWQQLGLVPDSRKLAAEVGTD
jgi:steroid delta-isomerase-like uncharacterized protein